MNTDPRETLANSPMCWLQILAVAITIGLNGLDGFDVLSISFASPGIAHEWGINNAQLGLVLSMELIGMAAGSLCLGSVADKFGRRPLMLGCLVVMTFGMYMATTANGTVDLSVYRVLTGLGIGGLLTAINAVAAEFSNARRRDLSVSIMSIGYPIGAIVGGVIAKVLLVGHDWRAVFYFGTAFTAIFIPLVFFFVPESVYWLARKQPANALQRINKTMQRMGHAAISELPVIPAAALKRSFTDIFSPGLLSITILVAITYFFHVTTFYFIIKWIPKLVNEMHFAASSAAGVLVWANVGGALGGATLGLLTQKFGVKGLTMGAMVLSTVMVILFGRSPPELGALSLICACAGFFTNGAIVGMYAIFARAFPTHVRASGTGVAIGIGRGGSVLAPIIAGFLLNGGVSRATVSLIMAFGSLLAAIVLSRVKLRPDVAEHLPDERDAEPLEGATV